MSTIAVLGGSGTFGARACRDLAGRGHRLIVAGRDLGRALAVARTLEGGPHEAVRVEATDLESCRRAVRGAAVVAVCAGPFSALGEAPARAALGERAHYVDIADDRGYIARLRGCEAEFAAAGRCAVFGASSLPGVSSVLAATLMGGGERPRHARVTLFIGNDNPKGEAAVRALVERLGAVVEGDGRRGRGFGDPEAVPLPAPFGRRAAYTFDGPERDLFPRLFGIPEVDVKVAFESRLANAAFATLARAPWRWGRRTAGLLAGLGRLLPRAGSSGGAVMVELTWADGRRASRALVADSDGQRMAALPCAAVAHRLAAGEAAAVGVRAPLEVIEPRALLAELASAGMRVVDA